VVDEVVRTHHAEVYEIKMEESPEKIIAIIMLLRRSSGKFRLMLAEDQSSKRRELKKRTGMERRLL